MSSTMRTGTTSFFGLPPMGVLFGLKPPPARVMRPAAARATEQRVEPTLRADVTPRSAPQPAAPVDLEKILAKARKAPQLASIEWDGDARLKGVPMPSAEAPVALPAGDSLALDARCRKIRDRYIGARFPGVVRSTADLENAESVIKAARLFFEDCQHDLSLELLDLAIAYAPRPESMRLAQLEIVFLSRNRARYVECARAFRAAHPASDAWPEVKRLGLAIAPGEALFGVANGPRDHDHYGPWPDLPNWIQASWDLTAEVVAADFHRAMKRAVPKAQLAA